MGREPADLASPEVRQGDQVRSEVAKCAATRDRPLEPPPHGHVRQAESLPVVPVDVRQLTEGTFVDQFLHQPGSRDKPIGEGDEGDHTPSCGFVRHRLGFGHAHCKGLLAADVHSRL